MAARTSASSLRRSPRRAESDKSRASPTMSATPDRARAGADRAARLRALFPDRARHRARSRARAASCARGAARRPIRSSAIASASPRSIPARIDVLVRALHQRRAQRAARHRCRFRARAARGGDPIHLREIRPRPRRARRHRDLLSRRAARSARSARRLGFRGDVVAALAGIVWGWSNDPIARTSGCARPGSIPTDRTLRLALDLAARADRLPAPSVAACRRLRDHPRAACPSWCRSRTRRWRTAPSSNGTRTISTRSAS